VDTDMPSDPVSVVAWLEAQLVADSYRLTRARHVILTVMATFGHPFTSTELEQAVAGMDASIGRASVYRTLTLMESRGVVEKLHQAGIEHYTLCLKSEHHHHVTCVECGRTEEFAVKDNIDLMSAVDGLARRLGYLPRSHVLEVYGVCPLCQESGAEASEAAPPNGHGAGGRHPLGRRADR